MSQISEVGIVITQRCDILCDHCVVSGSGRKKGTTSVEKLGAIFKQINECQSINKVCFTGGEPFIYHDLLAEGAKLVEKSSLSSSVVTNANWAISTSRCENRLSVLEHGIDTIAISCDKYHQQHVPLDNVKRVIEVGLGLGFDIAIMSTHLSNEKSNIKEVESSLHQYKDSIEISSQSIVPIGRAKELINERMKTGYCCCGVADKPVIDHDGSVHGCCGPSLNVKRANPLLLGNINKESLQTIVNKAQNNLFLQSIRVIGPKLFKKHLHSAGIEIPYECDHHCELCLKMCKMDNINEIVDAYYTKDNVTKLSLIKKLVGR